MAKVTMTDDPGAANWALLYQTQDDVVRFFEVRLVGTTVGTRSGRVATRGREGTADCGSPAAAQTAFAEKVEEIQRAGGTLARLGIMKEGEISKSLLLEEVREGARAAFDEIREAHPNEQMVHFALYTDELAMTLGAVADSERSFAEAGATGQRCWNCEEWEYYGGDAGLDIAYRIILAQHVGEASGSFQSTLFETCIRALADLQKQGSLTGGADEMLVLFAVEGQVDEDALRRLNSERTYQRFLEWREDQR